MDIIEIEPGRIIQRFEDWNADSIYFYDGSGNLAEFIVRYSLDNKSDKDFTTSSMLCVNEIGLATNDIGKASQHLEDETNLPFWKGDKIRFGTNGDENGLFLLPNYDLKKEWFPVDMKIVPSPFQAIILNNEKEYLVEYANEQIILSSLNDRS